MATSQPLEDLASCPVCFEIFIEPQILQCLHVLCIKCVKRLSKVNDILECPECRATCRIAEIRRDFNKQKLVDCYLGNADPDAIFQSCESCKSGDIEWRCNDCQMCICDSCQQAHSNFPATKTHDLQNIAEISKSLKSSVDEILPELDNLKNDLEARLNEQSDIKETLMLKQVDSIEQINIRRKTFHQIVDTNHDKAVDDITQACQGMYKDMTEQQGNLLVLVTNCEENKEILENLVSPQNYRTLTEQCKQEVHDIRSNVDEMKKTASLMKVPTPPQIRVGGIEPMESDFTFINIDQLSVEIKDTNVKETEPFDVKQNTVKFNNGDNLIGQSRDNEGDNCNTVDNLIVQSGENKGDSQDDLDIQNQDIQTNDSQIAHSGKKSDGNSEAQFDHEPLYVTVSKHELGHTSLGLKLHKNQIWSLGKDGAAYIYDTDCVYQTSVKDTTKMNYPVDFTIDCYDNVIFACSHEEGIKHFDPEFDYVTTFGAGTFYSVTSDGTLLYALKHDKSMFNKLASRFLKTEPQFPGKVITYQYTRQYRGNRTWGEMSQFPVQHKKILESDKMCVRNEFLYVSSNVDSVIYKYDLQGAYLAIYGQPGIISLGCLWGIHMCGTHPNNSIMVADRENHRIQLLTEQGEWSLLSFSGGVPKPVSVVVNGSSAWVVCNPCHSNNKLWKFKMK